MNPAIVEQNDVPFTWFVYLGDLCNDLMPHTFQEETMDFNNAAADTRDVSSELLDHGAEWRNDDGDHKEESEPRSPRVPGAVPRIFFPTRL